MNTKRHGLTGLAAAATLVDLGAAWIAAGVFGSTANGSRASSTSRRSPEVTVLPMTLNQLAMEFDARPALLCERLDLPAAS